VSALPHRQPPWILGWRWGNRGQKEGGHGGPPLPVMALHRGSTKNGGQKTEDGQQKAGGSRMGLGSQTPSSAFGVPFSPCGLLSSSADQTSASPFNFVQGRLRAATCHCERSAAISRFPPPRPSAGTDALALYGYQRGAIQMGRSPETRRSRTDASSEDRPPHRYPKCDRRCLCPRLGNNGPGEASFPPSLLQRSHPRKRTTDL